MNYLEYFTFLHENPKDNQYILYSDPLDNVFFETQR